MNLLGLEVNLIWCLLTASSVFVIVFGGLVNYLETFVPRVINDTFRYGKTRRGGCDGRLGRLLRLADVPKAYFLHFYVFACVLIPYLWLEALGVYCLERPASPWLLSALDVVSTPGRSAATSAESTFLALTLLALHCFRRLYECARVARPAGARMNLLHYAIGYMHYFCAGLALVAESPGFVPGRDVHKHLKDFRWLHVSLSWADLASLYNVSLAVAFMWAWYHQHRCTRILADLRTNGQSVYAVPHGDWFRWVSCPHYTAEIVMYLCLSLILGVQHETGLILWFWVVVNQVIAGLMSHFWYQEKFKEYPKSRKAVIPLLL